MKVGSILAIHPFRKVAEGYAHSKLILIGEHSVVYGKPAIALPFPSLSVCARIEDSLKEHMINFDDFVGTISKLPEKMKGLGVCIEETLKAIGIFDKKVKVTLKSDIPLGRGLGSSAALAIAIVRGIYKFFDHHLERSQLLKLVNIAETYAHGNPSGIDMEAASRDMPIWFKKGSQVQQISIGKPFYIIVADTGRIGDTRFAVESIKQLRDENPFIVQRSIDLLGDYAYEARDAIHTGNIVKLGEILNKAQHELEQLGVSDDGINYFVQQAIEAGAYGAKLTGGGKGGCIIALAEREEDARKISEALTKAKAHNTWSFKVENKVEESIPYDGGLF